MVQPSAASPHRLWLIFAASGVLFTIVYLLLPKGVAASAIWVMLGTAAVGALLVGKRMWRPADGQALYLITASQAAFVIATAIVAFYDHVLHRQAPFPSIADPIYLVGNLMLAAALFRLGRQRSRDAGPLLEAGFFGAAFAAAAWFLLIVPNLQSTTASTGTRIVSAIYPVTDVVLVAAAALLVVTPGRRPMSFILIAAGASMITVADVVYAWLQLHGSYSIGAAIDAGWLLGYVCLGAAALHPSMAGLPRHQPEQAPTLPVWRMGVLGGTSMATPALLLATQEQSASNLVAITVTTFLLFALTLLRASGLIRVVDEAVNALRSAEAKYRALIERVPAIIYAHGTGGHAPTFYVNAHTEAMLGYPAEHWTANPNLWVDLLHPDDRERLFATGRIGNKTVSDSRQDEYRLRARDGRYVWLRDESVLVQGEPGQPSYWHGIAVDVTGERAAQEAIRERDRQFRLLFSSNPHPMWVYDLETLRFLEVNDAAVAKYGYSRDEFLAMTILAIRPQTEIAAVLDHLEGDREPLELTTGWRHLTKDGTMLDVEITSHTLTFDDRAAALVVAQDVTERKALERQLAHQALHDALTDLPNRTLLADRLEHALTATMRRSNQVAILFLDLDRFKMVNDGLGHEIGDQLLIDVAKRLRACIRAEDTLARFGGDEFVVLLYDVPEAAIAEATAARIVEAITAPFVLDGQEVSVGISIGVALGRTGAHPGNLLREADVAMYHAKRHRLGYALFRAEFGAWARDRIGLEAELRRAIAVGGLLLHYQPIVDLRTERILAVEALVRWQHPTRGSIPPGEFIAVAEESGLIAPLGRWVLNEACRQLAAWRAVGVATAELGISINLSARQIASTGIVADVAAAVQAVGIRPADLELEITETVAMAEDERTITTLRALGSLGVRLAVDDFGAGASPLGYLRRCPVDALKIDRSFVAGLGTPQSDGERMIRAVLAFAKTLDMDVTAEGIETQAQAVRLREIGCERGQGYLFGSPQPAEIIAKLLAASGRVATPLLAAAG